MTTRSSEAQMLLQNKETKIIKYAFVVLLTLSSICFAIMWSSKIPQIAHSKIVYVDSTFIGFKFEMGLLNPELRVNSDIDIISINGEASKVHYRIVRRVHYSHNTPLYIAQRVSPTNIYDSRPIAHGNNIEFIYGYSTVLQKLIKRKKTSPSTTE